MRKSKFTFAQRSSVRLYTDQSSCIRCSLAILMFFIGLMPLVSQRLFYCDSLLVGDTYTGRCTIYYDFIHGRDTFQMDVGGDEEGNALVWDRNWQVVAKASNGLLHGPAYIIYENTGDTLFELNYTHGLLDGPCYEYNEKGDTIGHVMYHNGFKEGEQWKKEGAYFSNIDLQWYSVKNYKRGILHGIQSIRTYDGSFVVCRNYKNGKIHGVVFTQHINGMLKLMLLYKNDQVVDGEYYVFDWHGQPEEKLIFANGELVQTIKYPAEDDE